MKVIMKKRLVYHSPDSGNILIGNAEYDGMLTDNNILGSVHEVGKTEWVNNQLWLMRDNQMIYRITVDKFYQYERTFRDDLKDWIKKILRW